jgi:hypothetical protein
LIGLLNARNAAAHLEPGSSVTAITKSRKFFTIFLFHRPKTFALLMRKRAWISRRIGWKKLIHQNSMRWCCVLPDKKGQVRLQS